MAINLSLTIKKVTHNQWSVILKMILTSLHSSSLRSFDEEIREGLKKNVRRGLVKVNFLVIDARLCSLPA